MAKKQKDVVNLAARSVISSAIFSGVFYVAYNSVMPGTITFESLTLFFGVSVVATFLTEYFDILGNNT